MSETKEDSVPTTPQSLVTEEHLRAALAADKGSGAQLLSWEVKDFTKKGDNYACVVTSACVRYREGGSDGEVTYVVKCNPCRNFSMITEFTILAFEKEAGFYSLLVPLINAELTAAGQDPLRMAQCYNVHLEKGEEVILLRDLRPDGYKMFDRRKGMDKAHVTLVLRELARLHAASILVQAKMSLPMEEKYKFLLRDFFDNKNDNTDDNMMNTVFQGYVKNGARMAEKIGGYDNVVAWLNENAEHALALYAQCIKGTGFTDVLCHGDCWNNNVLFRYDAAGVPVEVRLLDLQVCRKGSPALDLNYLMYTSLNGPERKGNLHAFLKTYHDAFSHVLTEGGTSVPFTLEELRQEYHRKNLFGLLSGLMIVPMVVAEAADVMDLEDITDSNMEEKMAEYNQKMLDQLDTNKLLRPRLLATFEEMVEYDVIT